MVKDYVIIRYVVGLPGINGEVHEIHTNDLYNTKRSALKENHD